MYNFVFFYFQLWWSVCSSEQNPLCLSGRGHLREYLCGILINLDPVQEMSLNIYNEKVYR